MIRTRPSSWRLGVRNLCEKAAGYFSQRTSIQIYVALRIFDRRADGTRAMVALVYHRANPAPLVPAVTSFGTAIPAQITVTDIAAQGVAANAIAGVGFGGSPCNVAGIPLYQLNFATVDLFNGVPAGVPPGVPAAYTLDLWVVQDAALNYL